ncbi:MAG: hypothetical protein EHM45_23865 [Desulfobacteraceae bacterium]|nr:MAG: hypothetical protein EHM45_23865 [Desulfobacteraceae bacterium]
MAFVSRAMLKIFIHDRQTGATTFLSLNSSDMMATTLSLSSDGRYAAIESDAANLVPGDTNNRSDIFVFDILTGSITRVSIDSYGNQAANGHSFTASISGDGRYVTFSSQAANLVPDDTNLKTDIFVHDRQTGITTRVSVNAGGHQADNHSARPMISGDGRYVAFESNAANLVPGDTNNRKDIFVTDIP